MTIKELRRALARATTKAERKRLKLAISELKTGGPVVEVDPVDILAFEAPAESQGGIEMAKGEFPPLTDF